MLPPEELARVLPRLPTCLYSGRLFRAVHYEKLGGFHAPVPYSPDPPYPLGASQRGARFTPRGGMACPYMAQDPDTAYREANSAYLRVQAVDPGAVAAAPPTVIIPAMAHLPRVTDLMDPGIRSDLGTDAAELALPWRTAAHSGRMPATQQLGQAAFDSGCCQAIRYESAASPGHPCLAVFTDRLGPDGWVEVFDPDGNLLKRLP